MGEFEDEWEDDIESDDEVVNRATEGLEGSSVRCFIKVFSPCILLSFPITHLNMLIKQISILKTTFYQPLRKKMKQKQSRRFLYRAPTS